MRISKILLKAAGLLKLSVCRQGDLMPIKRMDNAGIVVEDSDAAIAFFTDPLGPAMPKGWRL